MPSLQGGGTGKLGAGAHCGVGLQRVFGVPWLGAEWEVGEKIKRLAVVDQVVAVLGPLPQSCGSECYCHTWSSQPLNALVTLNAFLL